MNFLEQNNGEFCLYVLGEYNSVTSSFKSSCYWDKPVISISHLPQNAPFRFSENKLTEYCEDQYKKYYIHYKTFDNFFVSLHLLTSRIPTEAM